MEHDKPLLTAAEASRRLAVSKTTLYAYVSRGLLSAHPDPADPRARRYPASEIAALRARRGRRRGGADPLPPEAIPEQPLVRTDLSTLVDGVLHYHGRNALALARTATVEQAARWLWRFDRADAAGDANPFGPDVPPPPPRWTALVQSTADWALADRVLARFAIAQRALHGPAWLTNPQALATAGGAHLRTLAACFLGTAPAADALPQQLARAWGLKRASEDVLRETMVLLADHPVNTLTFTSRCIASIGAALGPAMLAGLCAMSGRFAAAATHEVEACWDELAARRDIAQALTERLDRDGVLPGFNHPLYPSGDPRAERILSLASTLAPRPPLLSAVARVSTLRPTVDFAVVALRRALGAPPDAAMTLLFLSRSIGQIGHILEQRRSGRRIQPRSRSLSIDAAP